MRRAMGRCNSCASIVSRPACPRPQPISRLWKQTKPPPRLPVGPLMRSGRHSGPRSTHGSANIPPSGLITKHPCVIASKSPDACVQNVRGIVTPTFNGRNLPIARAKVAPVCSESPLRYRSTSVNTAGSYPSRGSWTGSVYRKLGETESWPSSSVLYGARRQSTSRDVHVILSSHLICLWLD